MHLNFGPNKTSAKKIALKKWFWISEPCGVFWVFSLKSILFFWGGDSIENVRGRIVKIRFFVRARRWIYRPFDVPFQAPFTRKKTSTKNLGYLTYQLLSRVDLIISYHSYHETSPNVNPTTTTDVEQKSTG